MYIGRSLISPRGEVHQMLDSREHYEHAQDILRERGQHFGNEGSILDASSVLEKEGWLRMESTGRTTLPNFGKVKQITQEQRNTLFDMAMAYKEDAYDYAAERIMSLLKETEEQDEQSAA